MSPIAFGLASHCECTWFMNLSKFSLKKLFFPCSTILSLHSVPFFKTKPTSRLRKVKIGREIIISNQYTLGAHPLLSTPWKYKFSSFSSEKRPLQIQAPMKTIHHNCMYLTRHKPYVVFEYLHVGRM